MSDGHIHRRFYSICWSGCVFVVGILNLFCSSFSLPMKDGAHSCCFHPDGNIVAIGTQTARWVVLDLATHEIVSVHTDGNEQIECVQFSPGKCRWFRAVCLGNVIQKPTQYNTHKKRPHKVIIGSHFSSDKWSCFVCLFWVFFSKHLWLCCWVYECQDRYNETAELRELLSSSALLTETLSGPVLLDKNFQQHPCRVSQAGLDYSQILHQIILSRPPKVYLYHNPDKCLSSLCEQSRMAVHWREWL